MEKTKNTLEKQVLDTFDRFWGIWSKRKNKNKTIDDITPFFDENISTIGTGDHEHGRTFAEVVQNFQADFNELEGPVDTHFYYKKIKILAPTVGIVEAEACIELDLEEGENLKFDLRFSTTFVKKEEQWLMVHNHVSIPSNEQDIGEAFPVDALRARNNRLQQLVSQRTHELEEKTQLLQVEKDKTEQLLFNILPQSITDELIQTGKIQPVRHEHTTVLFTDFKEFTKIASKITAQKLVSELNDIFFYFDDVIKAEKLEKIKTIGDSYMAVCGLPEEDEEHALRCINAARKMFKFLEERNNKNTIKWEMRLGIHSGPVVAGVVGNHKFRYDLWGNTVNLASRLESAGQEGKINISAQTYQLIKDKIDCSYRGRIPIKGTKEIDMYFVN